MKRSLNILLTLLLCITSFAQLSDQSEVYLISCTPGQPAWSYYGHSAIRIKDPALHFDCFYNYGIFDFNQDNFYVKFVNGQTDYMLGREDSTSFFYNYNEMGREIYFQKLNLTLDQRNQLLRALEINALPENRTYRYNFVFNNCATQPYKLIKQVVGKDFYTPNFDTRSNTFRQQITYYSGKNTWNGWGINILFGRDADKIMTREQRLFLPEELMDFMQEARIGQKGEKIVTESRTQPFVPRDTHWLGSPTFAILILCLIILAITILDIKRKRISWWFDAVMFCIYALLGSLLTYLAIGSEHPFVSSNYNLLFFNPLMFFVFALCLFEKGRAWLQKSDGIFGTYIIIALVIYLLSGQTFHSIVWISIVHAFRIRFTWYGNLFLLGQKTIKKMRRTASIIVCLAVCLHANAQKSSLTVVIAVDGLNNNALQQIYPTLLPGGLRTIMDEGKQSKIYFPQIVNGGCETLATVVTGVTPFYHGIAYSSRFNPEKQTIVPILQDNNFSGIGSPLHLSPKALLTPSLTDIFRLRNGKQSRIYAIGINPENTIILAGHAANACVWLDNSSQQPHWATTNYYPTGLHTIADQMNTNGKLNTIFYQPATRSTNEPIQYTSNANSAVLSLACAIQEQERLGEGLQNDLLLLELTCRTPNAQSDYLESAEQRQIYARLNDDLQTLIKQLFRRVGSQKIRLVLVGKPEQGYSVEALEDARLPHGTFNVSQAAALLNAYLMAMYGNGKYILGGHYNSIFLNHQLLEKRKLAPEQIIQLATRFLLEFEGIQSVYTSQQIPLIQGNTHEPEGQLRCSYNKQCFGDLLFTLQSGYRIINSDNSSDQITETDPEAPLYVLGPTTTTIPQSMDATQVLSIIMNE